MAFRMNSASSTIKALIGSFIILYIQISASAAGKVVSQCDGNHRIFTL
jgi:hypothetical protein